jgi:hypothetical protein
LAWKNGSGANQFSSDPDSPNYGTHDWIAEHALDWLPESEKRYIVNNLATYLYGTELPDKTTGADAIGDMDKQHFYFNETGVIKDNSAGMRTAQEYYRAVNHFENGDLYNGTMHLGIMTHYIADMAVYQNVMNSTYWGTPTNYNVYLDYVNSKITSYTSSEFDKYLKFDGNLYILPPEDGATAVAYNTTFDTNSIATRRSVPNGGAENCTWMDANYDWQDPIFKDRCGESLNYAVNLIADVLHSIYSINNTKPEAPKNLKITSVGGNQVELTWDENSEKNLGGYSIFINKTDDLNAFVNVPINVSKKFNSYVYTDLGDEVNYKFKITAYNILNRSSDPSNIVSTKTLDITPPTTPKLGDLSDITNKVDLTVSGFYTAEPGALIELYLNNDFSEPAGSNYSNPEYLGLYRITITLIEGENNITIRAVDAAGNPSQFSNIETVLLDSKDPVADAGKNIQVDLRKDPITVTFDGSNSTDFGGKIINYTWTIDYNFKLFDLYGPSPEFTFDQAGDYRCELLVSDQAENTDFDEFWVNITQKDIIPPYIVTKVPDVDQTNVSINITIRVKFNEPLDINSLKVRLVSNIEGEIQIPKPKYEPFGYLTLTPFTNLTHERSYMIVITANDLEGNALVEGTWSFSTVLRPEDFDGDQIPDEWEWKHKLNANVSDSSEDPDFDRLTNFDEYNKGSNSTDPNNPDTDDDGMTDYFERLFSLNPLDPSDKDSDPDGDGKTNYEEYLGSDQLPGNMDWTDPNQKPEDTPDGKTDDGDDYTLMLIVMVIIIVLLVILIIFARKIKYKESGSEEIKEEEDNYFDTQDPDELGIGGNILLEESKNYTEPKEKRLRPETERSMTANKSPAGKKDIGKSQKSTPEEIMARAKKNEKRCPKCNAGLPIDTNYCFECGAILNSK